MLNNLKRFFSLTLILAFGALFFAACANGEPGDPCVGDFDCDEGLICIEGFCE